MAEVDLIKIKEIAEKFGFEAEIIDDHNKEDSMENGTVESKDEPVLHPGVCVYARNTDGDRVRWFSYDSVDQIYSGNNTDRTNIWLHMTRPDLTPDMLVEMFTELCVDLKAFVAPEDWQEIAGVNDAYKDQRYTEMEQL